MLGLGGSRRAASQGGVDTLVGAQVVLRGDVQFAGGLYLEGQVFGRVLADPGAMATVTVAPRGVVEGEVRAPVVVIQGRVKGDVHASERLELGAGAKVEGNLHYAVIEMAAGASITGNLVHVPPAGAVLAAAKAPGASGVVGDATPA